jgi:hypothetical protein
MLRNVIRSEVSVTLFDEVHWRGLALHRKWSAENRTRASGDRTISPQNIPHPDIQLKSINQSPPAETVRGLHFIMETNGID